MPVPRIMKALPRGPITTAAVGIAVFATIHWANGGQQVVPATATAWTQEAVQVTWAPAGGDLRSDWIPAAEVTRGPPPR